MSVIIKIDEMIKNYSSNFLYGEIKLKNNI